MGSIFWVVLLGALPITEIRGAVLWGLGPAGFSLWEALGWAFLGNALAYCFLLWFLPRIGRYLVDHEFPMRGYFLWFFERTRKHHAHTFHKWEAWALFLLIAIPLPLTGAWTGAAAAYVFGINVRRALLPGLLGIGVSGIIVATGASGLGFLGL